MKLATPRWWYRRKSMVVPRLLLKPASWLWGAYTEWRIRRTEPLDPDVPVICVGNLTVGGTGKTPVVREVLAQLKEMGVTGHALSRGYGGNLKGPVRVDVNTHGAEEVGDEPLMLARDYPVWVSRNRLTGARAAAAAGAEAVVMDDGHQHTRVRKTLSLVVVDGETRDGEWPFGDGSLFPAGPMREPLEKGLARADAVVLLMPADLTEPDPVLLATFGDTPVLAARLEPAAPPPSGRQFGFAGVGKPWKVERALKAAGCELVDFAPFPDHQAYDVAAIKGLVHQARSLRAGLVTTEKDWVRLPAAFRDMVAAWPVRARFDNERGLRALLAGALKP